MQVHGRESINSKVSHVPSLKTLLVGNKTLSPQGKKCNTVPLEIVYTGSFKQVEAQRYYCESAYETGCFVRLI